MFDLPATKPSGKVPTLSKFSLANCLWLGRHSPLFRDASIGHQLLLALRLVVSTKMYLSSKGPDEVTRQQQNAWRHKFLQQGISGTSIVYGNGKIDQAMSTFPPTAEVLQETFIAVFSGPEKPPTIALTEEQQNECARAAMRREVEFKINKTEFDTQAMQLMTTNYVYRKHAQYSRDLVSAFGDVPSVPPCFEACAKFIPTSYDEEDVTCASGPASSTTASKQMLDAKLADELTFLTPWVSLLDEEQEDVADIASLPALESLLHKIETSAGRVIANELFAIVGKNDYGAKDDIGREKIAQLCKMFHWQCSKVSKQEEINALHWRVQSLAQQKKS